MSVEPALLAGETAAAPPPPKPGLVGRLARDGSIIVIPREGGYLVRLYVELANLDAGERIASRNITPDDLIAKARRILHPYTLEVKEIAWWSVYEIGQRLTDKFDD